MRAIRSGDRDKIVIPIRKNASISDAVCRALHPEQEGCKLPEMHSTLQPSLSQTVQSIQAGEQRLENDAWIQQIGVMLG